MKYKSLIFLVVLLAVLLIGAAIAYYSLADHVTAQQLATTPTTEETTAPSTEETTIPVTQATVPTSVPTTEPASTEEAQPEDFSAPDFTVFDFEGNQVQFSDFVGKPIVLNFWATWCDPCQSEMPGFNNVYEQLGGEVVFLMVNAREEQAVVQAYVEEQGFSFPVFLDTLGDATGTYGIYSYPITFFIDAQGNLITYAVGAISEELLMTGVDMIYTT